MSAVDLLFAMEQHHRIRDYHVGKADELMQKINTDMCQLKALLVSLKGKALVHTEGATGQVYFLEDVAGIQVVRVQEAVWSHEVTVPDPGSVLAVNGDTAEVTYDFRRNGAASPK